MCNTKEIIFFLLKQLLKSYILNLKWRKFKLNLLLTLW